MMFQYVRNFGHQAPDKENDYQARPITSRSRSPYQPILPSQVMMGSPNVYYQEPIQITYYGDYQSNAKPNKDLRYQTPNILSLKQQNSVLSSNVKQQLYKNNFEPSERKEHFINVPAKGQAQTQTFLNTPKITIKRDEYPAQQQLKKIIGVRKSPQDSQSSFNLSYNRQSIISNISGGTMKQSTFEMNSKNCSPIAPKPYQFPSHSHNKSYTHELQTKTQSIKQRCKSPTACDIDFAKKQSKDQIVNPYTQYLQRNNSILDRSNEEVDLTYTHTHTHRSGQQFPGTIQTRRMQMGSPEEAKPIVIGKLLFNEHFSHQSSKLELSSKRNLSFNQLLDSQKQRADLSARKSSQMSASKKKTDPDPPRRVSIAPFSEKKEENEIQQMVETLKQNILRDLQEVNKRCQVPSNKSYECSLKQVERSNDSGLNRFSFNQHELSGRIQTNQSQLSARESLQKASIQSYDKPNPCKTSFHKEGAQLFHQLSTVLNNGKEFYQQINSQRVKKEDPQYNSPEEPKKQGHKSNTPSFHQQQFSISSAVKVMPSPLQLSFNISDIVSDHKPTKEQSSTKEMSESPVQLKQHKHTEEVVIVDLSAQGSVDSIVKQSNEDHKSESSPDDGPHEDHKSESSPDEPKSPNESNLNECEPEEEQICSQQTPRYSEAPIKENDPISQITINNLSSITPDGSLLPQNKKLNVSLDSFLHTDALPEQEFERQLLQEESVLPEQQTPQLIEPEEPLEISVNITVDNTTKLPPQGSATRQERYQQLLRNFKEYRCQSNHQSQVKFDLPNIITPKAQSICDAPQHIDHISDFIIHSQGQRESAVIPPVVETPPASEIVESVAITKHSEASQKLITFNNESEEVDTSVLRQMRVVSKRRFERPHCPSFREVLRERDRSATRPDQSHSSIKQNSSVCRKINFSTYNTVQEAHSVIDDLISQPAETMREPLDNHGLSFLEYMKRKHN